MKRKKPSCLGIGEWRVALLSTPLLNFQYKEICRRLQKDCVKNNKIYKQNALQEYGCRPFVI